MEEYKILEYNFKVDEDFENNRVDYVIANLTDLTRSFIKKNIIELKINGKNSKLSKKVKQEDKVNLKFKKIVHNDKIIPQFYPLKILYEDNFLIIVRKPFNIPVHPSFGHENNTLCNYVMDYLMKKEIFLEDAGMVHRLDMDTEGLIIFAKDKDTQKQLKLLFETRNINKYYFAITRGTVLPKEGILEDNLIRNPYNRLKYTVTDENKGKNAKLAYKNIMSFNNYSLLNIKLLTGRTHQIRVQFSTRGYPLIGDRIYSRNYKKYFDKFGLLLFSYRLNFKHPKTSQNVNVIDRIPERFINFINEYF